MIDVYVRLIEAGIRTIDSVPERLREAVRKKLEENGNNAD